MFKLDDTQIESWGLNLVKKLLEVSKDLRLLKGALAKKIRVRSEE